MAQVLKAGNIKVDLEANANNLIRGFKNAVDSLKKFGEEEEKVTSKSKRLEDTLADLERRKKTLNKQLDETADKFGENSVQADKLRDRIANLSDRIATQNIRIDEAANKTGSMKNAFQQAGDKMGIVANTISVAVGNVIADAFSNATQAVYDYAASVFEAAIQTEQQGVAFRVLTGSLDNSRKLMAEINDMAVKTPYDIGEIRDLTKQMLSFGFGQDEVIGQMKMLGDITAGTGGDLKLLARAYGQVKTKGKLYAQELNQLGEQGLAVREILADSMGISVSDLMVGMENKQISVEFEQFAEIMEKVHKEKFLNLMAEQADTVGGRIQNLGETLSLLGQEILGIDTLTGEVKKGGVFDFITTALERFLSFLNENKQPILDFFEQAQSKIKELWGVINNPTFKDLAQQFWITLGEILGVTLPIQLQYLKGAFKSLFEALTRFYNENREEIKILIKIIAALFAFFIIGIIAIITWLVQFSAQWYNTFSDAMNVFRSFKQGVENVINGIKVLFSTLDLGKMLIQGLVKGINDNAWILNEAIRTLGNGVISTFKERLGISSPSKVMIEAGVDITDGLDIGLQKGQFDVERRVSIMADNMIDEVTDTPRKPRNNGGLTINQYGATISTSWIPSYAR